MDYDQVLDFLGRVTTDLAATGAAGAHSVACRWRRGAGGGTVRPSFHGVLQMLIQIVLHTPKWVFTVLLLLLWLGLRQWSDHELGLRRVLMLPLVMGGLSVHGMVSVFGDSPAALGGWAAALLAVVALTLRRPLPAGTRYDAARRRFHVAGSPWPLVLLMGIFLTRYAVGVALALHPELRQQALFGFGVPVLYGVFGGVFVARAARLWRLAGRGEAAPVAAGIA